MKTDKSRWGRSEPGQAICADGDGLAVSVPSAHFIFSLAAELLTADDVLRQARNSVRPGVEVVS